MKLSIVNNAPQDMWDDLIANSHAATAFHSSVWLNSQDGRWKKIVIADTNLTSLAGIAIEDRNHSALHGHSITPYEGPLLRDDNLTGARRSKHRFSLMSRFERALSDHSRISFMTSPWFDDLRAFVVARWKVELLYTNILNARQMEDLGNTIDPQTRREIRVAREKIGAIEIYDHPPNNIIQTALDLTGHSYNRQGLPVRFNQKEAATTFQNMADAGCAFFVIAREKTEDISCAVGIFEFNHRAHLLISGHNRAIATPCVVGLTVHDAIVHAAKRGAKEFDFEGSFIGGIDRFFRQFGGNPTPFYEVTSP